MSGPVTVPNPTTLRPFRQAIGRIAQKDQDVFDLAGPYFSILRNLQERCSEYSVRKKNPSLFVGGAKMIGHTSGGSPVPWPRGSGGENAPLWSWAVDIVFPHSGRPEGDVDIIEDQVEECKEVFQDLFMSYQFLTDTNGNVLAQDHQIESWPDHFDTGFYPEGDTLYFVSCKFTVTMQFFQLLTYPGTF